MNVIQDQYKIKSKYPCRPFLWELTEKQLSAQQNQTELLQMKNNIRPRKYRNISQTWLFYRLAHLTFIKQILYFCTDFLANNIFLLTKIKFAILGYLILKFFMFYEKRPAQLNQKNQDHITKKYQTIAQKYSNIIGYIILLLIYLTYYQVLKFFRLNDKIEPFSGVIFLCLIFFKSYSDTNHMWDSLLILSTSCNFIVGYTLFTFNNHYQFQQDPQLDQYKIYKIRKIKFFSLVDFLLFIYGTKYIQAFLIVFGLILIKIVCKIDQTCFYLKKLLIYQ